MPYANYLAEHMGSASIAPEGPFEAGSLAALTLTYVAGKFGIDDSGHLKIAWRGTSDMAKPQFRDPTAPNYTTVEASNGAVLDVRVDRINIRPWVNTLFIRVNRGFLRQGDTITVRFGDRRQGAPGLRLQTNTEPTFEFKVLVDAFATYEFTELARSPEIALVAGAPARWKAIWPTLAVAGAPFRLAVLTEDAWGNPTDRADETLQLLPSRPVAGLPEQVTVRPGEGAIVCDDLRVQEPGDLTLRVLDRAGRLLCTANPLRVAAAAELRHFWGDLHGQSEETIGTNSVEDYFHYARDKAFLDIVGHQGNDFQITDAFWERLNSITRAFDVPGRFVAVPGYEWSGNTGMGGDRNVFFRREGRPIRRSSSILVEPGTPRDSDCHTAAELFAALEGEDAVVIAHVGGRYADIRMAHDGRLERAVEVHSTWGTFEWLLHDAFDLGYRPGVVCHSDDHKGRPGATRPGASHFGAIGGLTCYLMPDLSRASLFDALRRRHHYGTTGTRMFLSVTGTFATPVAVFDDDPAFTATTARRATGVLMGDIVQPGATPMQLQVEAVGSAPIERIDLFHGKDLVRTVRPFAATELGRRIRVMWQGAEYRGRGREVPWQGTLSIEGGRFERAEPVNFLNPENPLEVQEAGKRLAWRSVTTGNMAGIDLWLTDGRAEELRLDTNLASGRFSAAEIGFEDLVLPAGGLGRQIRLFRLPDHLPHRVAFAHDVALTGAADLPVFVRVTQADGNQAWSSPIYLIAPPVSP
ncbi:MAG: DUF3604 domain-containing protein [Proteobacteria bacterium]|nr:DUF3604 domain-containing protein [Pseudomonadota bacterium]